MKSLKIYWFIVTIFVLTACVNKNKQDLSLGTYFGKLPCADCSAINLQLQINEDSTYTLNTLYEDKETEGRRYSGTYAVSDNGVLTLRGQAGGMEKFVISDKTLQMLDNSGKPINSEMSEKYILTQYKPEDFYLEEKLNNTNDFKATGNEPSWVLEIDFDNKIHFKTIAAEKFELTTPVPEPQKAQDADITRYWTETEKGTLEVSIQRQSCTDDMSGNINSFSVRVRAKTSTMETFQEFSGCGSYLENYRVNNVWLLESINDEPILKNTEKQPNLEFDLAQNKVYGFGGCNRLNGTLKIENERLIIERIATNRMACPNMEIEDEFLSLISDTPYVFSINENKLILKNENKKLEFNNLVIETNYE